VLNLPTASAPPNVETIPNLMTELMQDDAETIQSYRGFLDRRHRATQFQLGEALVKAEAKAKKKSTGDGAIEDTNIPNQELDPNASCPPVVVSIKSHPRPPGGIEPVGIYTSSFSGEAGSPVDSNRVPLVAGSTKIVPLRPAGRSNSLTPVDEPSSALLGELETSEVVEIAASGKAKAVSPIVIRPHIDEDDLAHPAWYLGFWRDTKIEIEFSSVKPFPTPPIIPRALAEVKLKFGSKPWNPEITANLTRDDHGTKTIWISRYFKSGAIKPTRIDEDDFGHVIEAGKKAEEQGTKGYLVVYNADLWRNQVADRKTTDGKWYIDTDLFDNIKLTVEAAADIRIKRPRIMLNGVWVLNKKDPLTAAWVIAGRCKRRHLDQMIKDYRGESNLLDISGITPGPRYDENAILWNAVVKKASGDIGQAWSPKYGGEWSKYDGEFDNSPRFWCSEFATWAIQAKLPNIVHATGDDPNITTNDVKDWFDQHGTYLCAGDDWATANRRYDELGARVTIGSYVGVLMGGHSTVFLYWIGRNGAARRHSKLNELTKDLFYTNPAEGAVEIGHFDPGADFNWFAVINGNSGGRVRALRYFCVINLCRARAHWLPYLLGKRASGFVGRSGELYHDQWSFNLVCWATGTYKWTTYQDGFGLV
jgi:hypothetical protein